MRSSCKVEDARLAEFLALRPTFFFACSLGVELARVLGEVRLPVDEGVVVPVVFRLPPCLGRCGEWDETPESSSSDLPRGPSLSLVVLESVVCPGSRGKVREGGGMALWSAAMLAMFVFTASDCWTVAGPTDFRACNRSCWR